MVVSTAIREDNPELKAAREAGIEIWHRAKMLAALGVGKSTLAVAGTHGKTTSSSMLASLIDGIGLDPTFLIGGIVRAYNSNAHSGKGEYYVVEADEQRSVVHPSRPERGAHHEHRGRSSRSLTKTSMRSISSSAISCTLVPEDGCCVVCGEDEALVRVARSTGRKIYTYGFDEAFDTTVSNYQTHGLATSFDITLPDGSSYSCQIKQNPGRHNALNAAGVLTLNVDAWIRRCRSG